jgi:hypothetical protein
VNKSETCLLLTSSIITYIPPPALICMTPYIYAALILYAASLGLSIAGQTTASAAAGVASVALMASCLPACTGSWKI